MELNQSQSNHLSGGKRLPESPRPPMEFLSRSWSSSSFNLSKTLDSKAPTFSLPKDFSSSSSSNSNFSSTTTISASSSSSHLVLDRIMSERIMSYNTISPMTSGRPSHSSGPLTGEGPLLLTPTREFDDVIKFLRASGNDVIGNGTGIGTPQVQIAASCQAGAVSPGGGNKTVGRWLKDRKERRKEETRAQNGQLHAAVSVAGVAAAVAALSAAAAAGMNDKRGKLDMAVASAATLVAAQCVEAAEGMGVERDQLASIVGSAVNVQCYDDIVTLTAAAATALRGAATLKARVVKDIQNVVVTLSAKEMGTTKHINHKSSFSEAGEELACGETPISTSVLEFLGRGQELLKRTRNGDLHWKVVSVYIHRSGEVMLKMKSKYVGGTITNKKKNIVQKYALMAGKTLA